ncbi:MAG: alpha/beta hydrolase [Chloroflexales bacterium]|nr:alpha/beta hydrolase [Chloroflexales bacterium]
MAEKPTVHPADVHGVGRLAVEATLGITNLVEAMHQTILRLPWIIGAPIDGPTGGITGLVYTSIRGITQLVGGSLDAVLTPLIPLARERRPSPEHEAMLSALNGVLGDYLAANANPLALPMLLRQGGQPLDLADPALADDSPPPGGKILLMVHGLCLNDRHWSRGGHDHGAALAADLGYTPVYLHYNTGLHISANGRAFADVIEALVRRWPTPVEELTIVAHSMGGLVSRSAWHYAAAAGHAWPRHLRSLVFLGTPHHGAPLERGGNWLNLLLGVSPYTAAFTRLGNIRSAGITDLRYGNLLDEDWEGHDRFAHVGDKRQPVPLPDSVRCYAVAATTGKAPGDLSDKLIGDGLVPVSSALGHHHDPHMALSFPESRQWVGYAMNHMELLDRPEVYAQLRQWLTPVRQLGC